MTFSSVSASARLTADIIPGDPRSSGTYQIGASSQRHSLTEANQVYTVKVSAQVGEAPLDLITGILVIGTGTKAGGDGKDPDGQTVALDEVHGIHILNTGENPLKIAIDDWTGSPALLGNCFIPVGGEVLVVDPAGSALTVGDIIIGEVAVTNSWEATILGKILP